jgi:hypothetical protein
MEVRGQPRNYAALPLGAEPPIKGREGSKTCLDSTNKNKNSVALSPETNYTD